MTAEMKDHKFRDTLDLRERYIISSSHQMWNQDELIDNQTPVANYNQKQFKHFMAQCGDLQFEIDWDESGSKAVRFGRGTYKEGDNAECVKHKATDTYNNSVTRFIRRGCDLSVFKINYASVKINKELKYTNFIKEKTTKTNSNNGKYNLKKISGFDPTAILDNTSEFTDVLFLSNKNKYIQCSLDKKISHLEKEIEGALTVYCNNHREEDLKEHGILSGSVVLGNSKDSNGRPFYFPNSKPAAIGVVTKIGNTDNGGCRIEIDLMRHTNNITITL